MMQACASAAKLRGGGPILDHGIETMVDFGSPPPRIVRPVCGEADGRPKLASLVLLF
jgi:hypothetical protein